MTTRLTNQLTWITIKKCDTIYQFFLFSKAIYLSRWFDQGKHLMLEWEWCAGKILNPWLYRASRSSRFSLELERECVCAGRFSRRERRIKFYRILQVREPAVFLHRERWRCKRGTTCRLDRWVSKNRNNMRRFVLLKEAWATTCRFPVRRKWKKCRFLKLCRRRWKACPW